VNIIDTIDHLLEDSGMVANHSELASLIASREVISSIVAGIFFSSS
jgi:hypothetical protein